MIDSSLIFKFIENIIKLTWLIIFLNSINLRKYCIIFHILDKINILDLQFSKNFILNFTTRKILLGLAKFYCKKNLLLLYVVVD